jgi:hypothetical protein
VRSEGLEGCQSEVMGHADVTQGDVDPRLTCHVSPGFVCFAYPIDPLTRDTCHPLKGPRVITASTTYHTWHSLLGPSGGRSMRDPPVFSLVFNTSPRARVDPLGVKGPEGQSYMAAPREFGMWDSGGHACRREKGTFKSERRTSNSR